MSAEPTHAAGVHAGAGRTSTGTFAVHQRVLLASHGTAGARAAEALALACCAPGGTLLHLYVVPDLWRGMMGDDWLNNARTRIRFGDYLEGELASEADACLERVAAACASGGVVHEPLLRQGEPADCLVTAAREGACGLVVVGMPRPKGEDGLRSRLVLDTLVRGLGVPLLIAPRTDG
ncbi:MAG TPA: universal stress protein [Gammaproteobacteria bacterium]